MIVFEKLNLSAILEAISWESVETYLEIRKEQNYSLLVQVSSARAIFGASARQQDSSLAALLPRAPPICRNSNYNRKLS